MYNSTILKRLSRDEAKLLKSILQSKKETEILKQYKKLCKRLFKRLGKGGSYLSYTIAEIISKIYSRKLIRHRRGGNDKD